MTKKERKRLEDRTRYLFNHRQKDRKAKSKVTTSVKIKKMGGGADSGS